MEQAFRGIIAKDEHALERLDRVMDNVEAIHYGNWNAAVMRIMHFTGDLGAKLNQYTLLDIDFYKMQDELQRKVEALRLLRETDEKTYEIAEQVGYNNVRRFVDAKQIYSVSPMEYRKTLREK